MRTIHAGLLLGALLSGGSAGVAQAQTNAVAPSAIATASTHRVDGRFIRADAANRAPDWPSHGLDYAETRFSKLDQVTIANVKQLGLAWTQGTADAVRPK